MFEITKDIPLPTTLRSKYPFGVLNSGESFFVPNGKKASMTANCIRYGKKLNARFVTRCEGDGVRVWRVE